MQEVSGNGFYARGMNLERVAKKAYDDALEKYDVIVMPTLPYVARKLHTEGKSVKGNLIFNLFSHEAAVRFIEIFL